MGDVGNILLDVATVGISAGIRNQMEQEGEREYEKQQKKMQEEQARLKKQSDEEKRRKTEEARQQSVVAKQRGASTLLTNPRAGGVFTTNRGTADTLLGRRL